MEINMDKPIKVHESFTMQAGVWLNRSMIKPENIEVAYLAKCIGLEGSKLNGIFEGDIAMDEDTAQRLESELGVSAEKLMRMQKKYEELQDRQLRDQNNS